MTLTEDGLIFSILKHIISYQMDNNDRRMQNVLLSVGTLCKPCKLSIHLGVV